MFIHPSIKQIPITVNNAMMVVETTAELTKEPKNIQSQDICNAINILDDVAALELPDTEVRKTQHFVRLKVADLFWILNTCVKRKTTDSQDCLYITSLGYYVYFTFKSELFQGFYSC